MPHAVSPRRVTVLALLVLTAAGLAGCRGPQTSNEPYQGPPMRMAAIGGLHAVVVESPSPGWRVVFERSRPSAEGQQIMLTVRQPDPQFIYPQVIVEQQVITDVPAEKPALVFARTLSHNERRRGGTFRRVPLTEP